MNLYLFGGFHLLLRMMKLYRNIVIYNHSSFQGFSFTSNDKNIK